jgi:hypothetical protein
MIECSSSDYFGAGYSGYYAEKISVTVDDNTAWAVPTEIPMCPGSPEAAGRSR